MIRIRQAQQVERSGVSLTRLLPCVLPCVLTGVGAVAAAVAPRAPLADTVYTFDLASTSDLAGASSGSPSGFCAPGDSCPTDATYALGANVLPVTGALSIDTTTSQMTFDIVLGANATFTSSSSGSVTLDAGSSFVASSSTPNSSSIGVSVSSATKKGVTTDTVLPGTGTYTVLSTLILPSGTTQTQSQPILSGLDCSFTVGSTGTCGFVLGTPDTGATNILQINNGSPYDGVLSFNLNMTPVPLPASLWLMAGSMGGLVLLRRRSWCNA